MVGTTGFHVHHVHITILTIFMWLTVRIQKAQLIFLACVRDRKLHVFNLHSLLLSKFKNPKLILNDLIVDYETN